MGIRGLNGTFEQDTDCHFCDRLRTGLLVSLDFVDTDIVLAITG